MQQQTYEVWATEDGESEARDVEAWSPEEAAEKYADRTDFGTGTNDFLDDLRVSVRCPDGSVVRFRVEAEAMVQYYAYEIGRDRKMEGE